MGAGLGLGGCEPDIASNPGQTVRPVRWMTATLSNEPAPQLAGELQAASTADASFRMAGRIAERLVSPGDRVDKGQILARLDSELAANDVKAARAKLAADEALAAQASQRASRSRALLPKEGVSRNTYDLDLRQEAQAREQVKASRAALAQAEERLGWCELRAEAAGVVVQRFHEAGENVGAGNAVFRIAQAPPLDAVFDLPERLVLDGAGLGSSLRVCGQTPQGEVCAKARLYEIAPQADRMTRTFRAKARLDDGALAVLPLGSGLAGTLERAAPSAVILPRTAVGGAGDARYVWIVDRDGRVHRRQVGAVRELSPRFVAAEGIAPGDKVVTAGISALEEGQQVRTPDSEREISAP
ncbi:MAG: efflux RND transporter periplasmic adaptor subunit [Desulfovibrio sp.]|nr:efflux RND transporter periplasmic adaptor subunit [Desulfovibrio sp.]